MRKRAYVHTRQRISGAAHIRLQPLQPVALATIATLLFYCQPQAHLLVIQHRQRVDAPLARIRDARAQRRKICGQRLFDGVETSVRIRWSG